MKQKKDVYDAYDQDKKLRLKMYLLFMQVYRIIEKYAMNTWNYIRFENIHKNMVFCTELSLMPI